MSERDEELLRLYRAPPREAPPPPLDAAILAASRRPARAPGLPRWAAGLSVAAVLVLALGLVLKVQREAPDAGMPVESRATAPAAAPAPSADASAPESRSLPPQKPAKVESRRVAPKRPAPRTEEPAVMAAPAAAPVPAPAPPAVAASSASAHDEKATAADAARANAAPPARAMQRSLAVDPLQRELERIARLREEGKDDEADTALATFKRAHPDYRIEPTMLERVRRR